METKVAEQAVEEQGSRVDEQQGKKKMRLMVAVDESEWSFYALKWALDHLFVGPNDKAGVAATLKAPAGSQENVSMVTLVHVMPPLYNYVLPAGPGGAAYYVTPAVVESVRKAQEDGAAEVLSRALEICKDKMIKAETLILRGDPKDMICEATEQRHVDLLVVGSRGLGMVKRKQTLKRAVVVLIGSGFCRSSENYRAFLGSVSDYCAHHAKCPVVIVKPPKESGKPPKESGKNK